MLPASASIRVQAFVAVMLAIPLLVLAGCGGSGDGAATRGAVAAKPLPTTAFITTGPTGMKGNPKLFRCALPDGPCTEWMDLGSDYQSAVSLQYADGRAFFRTQPWTNAGLLYSEQPSRVMSCSATRPRDCTVLLQAASAGWQYDTGPLYRAGRLIVGVNYPGPVPVGLYSCDPSATRSVTDCTRLPIAPRLDVPALLGRDELVGIVYPKDSRDTSPREVAACRIDNGACRTLGTVPALRSPEPVVPGVDYALAYLPQFGRVYVAAGQMWSCDAEGTGGCSRLNTFGTTIQAFAGVGDRVFAGTEKSIQSCSPTAADNCSMVTPELNVSQLLPYGDSLLVGTRAGDPSSTTGVQDIGGLYVRPTSGAAGSSIWHKQPGGVASLATDLSSGSVLKTTVVRYTPRGSTVTATGTVALSPGPEWGDRECVLRPPELPVTCTSSFAPGMTVTLTAKPGAASTLNTWQGAASTCNEPGGPGTPPATTCTITLTGSETAAIASFRPASEPTPPPTPTTPEPTPTTPTTPTTPEPTPPTPATTSADPTTPPEPTPPAPGPAPQPIPTPPGPPPAPDAPLQVTGLSLTRQAFTATQGTQIRYRLTKPANVTLVFTYGRGKAKGTRYAFTIKAGKTGAKAGNNRVRVRGVVKGQKVRTGRWNLTVRAAAGGQKAQATAPTARVTG